MADFAPIAIIGQACVLPGALTPEQLWELVAKGRSALGPPPEGRWRADISRLKITSEEQRAGREGVLTERGGYVTGFAATRVDSSFLAVADPLAGLEPMYHWLVHVGREALISAGLGRNIGRMPRAGAIFGNLFYPTQGLSELAEIAWLGRRAEGRTVDQRNRFASGFPIHFLCRTLGLGAGGFALDAACASSLYAIKFACDWLLEGRADVMLAGGVNAGDFLGLNLGFTALNALSPTGRSRPFHADADGLLPAEGAAAVALKRLEDAVAADDNILGVIRAVGLSNDGRGGGFLAPSPQGQVKALRAAYKLSGISPEQISLIECHATGTAIGDSVEIRSTAAVFDGVDPAPIGSLKSNLGHLTTASGAAALIKVLMAMRHRVRPPSLNARPFNAALEGAPFRVLEAAEAWEARNPRCAAVSAFGFGGNNAHLIVEEWSQSAFSPTRKPPRRPIPIAIIGLGVHAGPWRTAAEVEEQFLTGAPCGASRIDAVRLAHAGLRVPPLDLARALPQHVLMLSVMLDALQAVPSLPFSRTGVLAGMGCDPDAARHFLRARLSDLAHEAAADEAGVPKLDAAGVVGAMGNILANRMNAQFDMGGFGFSVAAEEASGIRALELAIGALRSGELDAALVGAVDLSDEPVHRAAAQALLARDRQIPGDAACALVLKRLDDARRDGCDIIGVLDPGADMAAGLDWSPYARRHRECFGHAHAADGLLQLCCAVLAIRRGVLPPRGLRGASPWLSPDGSRCATLKIEALGTDAISVTVREGDRCDSALRGPPDRAPIILAYGGRTLDELEQALSEDAPTPAGRLPDGPRIVLATTTAERERDRAIALEHVKARRQGKADAKLSPQIVFRSSPLAGEVAFVFTGAAAAYPDMGRELLLAVPSLVESLRSKIQGRLDLAKWVYEGDQISQIDGFSQLVGASMLCQAHGEFSRLIDLHPAAAIGLSSGETNALFALGAWRDMGGFIDELGRSDLYSRRLGGSFDDVRAYWRNHAIEGRQWAAYTVQATREEIEKAVFNAPAVHLLIVNSPSEYVVGGEQGECQRILERFAGRPMAPLPMSLAVHCPELIACAGLWRTLHHRPTRQPSGVRFYFNAHGEARALDPEMVADALLAQALETVDFPRTIRRAWEDGVRIFVEHGPRDHCSRWIAETLDQREHLAVAYDVLGRSSLTQALVTVANLVASGVRVNLDWLSSALTNEVHRADGSACQEVTFLGHRPAVSFAAPAIANVEKIMPASIEQAAAPIEFSYEIMAPAPTLAPPSAFLPPKSGVSQIGSGILPDSRRPADAAGRAAQAEDSGRPAVAASPKGRLIQAVHELMTEQHLTYLRQAADMCGAFQQLQRGVLAPAAVRKSDVSPFGIERANVETSAPARAPLSAVSGGSGSLASAQRDSVPQGPSFDRSQLECLASGKISTVFGALFEQQDQFARQVRLPAPPLLLVDRVTGMTGEPGSGGTGSIWTETDIYSSAWYLHDNHMPAGIAIESGQADLLLISWLGADLHNRGARVYRLLGCELTLFGGLPEVGDTLKFDIHVDGHTQLGELRLFHFHYDLRINGDIRMSVRNGQAGFFTDEEMTRSEGVLWEPGPPRGASPQEIQQEIQTAASVFRCVKSRFTESDVLAFSEGRISDCFGPGYELAACHTRSPRFPSGKMLLIGEAPAFDPAGGPQGRGYLRAEWRVSPDDWFFQGHFKNDPCMPGTLMFEACLQAMALQMTAMGYTLSRDGWRFEPAPHQTYRLHCRGQVTPKSRCITYEVFVSEAIEGPIPSLTADVLATVDGLKAFQCSGLTLQLRPAWPLDERRGELAHHDGLAHPATGLPPARRGDFSFDYRAMLASAIGRPSEAFGAFYQKFDGPMRVPRLPAPPYLFMTSVNRIDGEMGAMAAGASVESEYAIPADAWYFDANGARVIPFFVLLEAALQPCGWLASYSGFAVNAKEELFFRNLDGSAIVHSNVGPDDGILTTRAKLVSVSRIGGTVIVGFEVQTRCGNLPIVDMNTSFGFFPAEALALQPGLPSKENEIEDWGAGANNAATHETLPPQFFDGTARLARSPLLMLDRVTGWWPQGGRAGLGRIRGEKDIAASEWFFKAHFFQDPVQPGSLGLEAMLQLLQVHMILAKLVEGFDEPSFEPIASGQTAIWKYRGQVTPLNSKLTILLDIVEHEKKAESALVKARGSLWVDGKKIYETPSLAMRARAGVKKIASERKSLGTHREEQVSPIATPWISDHCPTYVVPCLPMMWVVDRIAQAASRARPDRALVELRDIRLFRWLSLPYGRPLDIRTAIAETSTVERADVVLEASEDPLESGSSFSRAATGSGRFASGYDREPDLMVMTGLEDWIDGGSLYADGTLFHGPSFQVLRKLRRSREGAVALLDTAQGGAPDGVLNPALLDGVAQIGSITDLGNWFDLDPDFAPYPAKVERLRLFGPVPSRGLVECRIARRGFAGEGGRLPLFVAQIIEDEKIALEIELAYMLFPKGPLGAAPSRLRRSFLKDKRAVLGMGLGQTEEGATVVGPSDIERSDWLKGSVASLYGCPDLQRAELLEMVAVKQHVARQAGVHPFHVVHHRELGAAQSARLPFNRYSVSVTRTGAGCKVADAAPAYLDLAAVRDFWWRREQLQDSVMFDLLLGLIQCFVRKFEVDGDQKALIGRPAIYLSNHQTYLEGFLFNAMASAFFNVPMRTIIKTEHRKGWVGVLDAFAGAEPGTRHANAYYYFDQADPRSLYSVMEQFVALQAEEPHSLMVFVEGRRARSAKEGLSRMSSALPDFAVMTGMPVVPLRISGGLPVEPLTTKAGFPFAFGQQDYVVGAPIEAAHLRDLTSKERAQLVVEAVNALPPGDAEAPLPGCNRSFVERIQTRAAARSGGGDAEIKAALIETFLLPASKSARFHRIINALTSEGKEDPGDDWARSLVAWLIHDD